MRFRVAPGFTLIELLVVIAVIGILASIVIASLSGSRARARIASGLQFEHFVQASITSADHGGRWMFDEGSGSVVHGTLFGTVGTIVNAAPFVTDTPSGKGYALSLNGTNQYVSIPGTGNLASVTEPGTPGFTVATWFKATGLPMAGNDGYIVFRAGFHVGLMMSKTTGHFEGVLWYSNNTATVLDSGVNINDNTWHYLTMSVNDSSKLYTLYIDGNQVASYNYANHNTNVLRTYGTSNYYLGGAGTYMSYGLIDNPVFAAVPIN